MHDLRSYFLSLLTCAVVVLSGCGLGVRINTITTTVAPLATDDLSGPCIYEMAGPPDAATQSGVLVVFERGDDVQIFEDPSIQKMALELNLTTVFAHQCDAISYGDLQSDASQGPARALFLALGQFATITHHPEFATTPVILYGFSAAGTLAMTMSEARPDRAPWGYAVQNDTDHCCNLSTLNIILPWIRAIAAKPPVSAGSPVSFVCVPDGAYDSYGTPDCDFTFAGLGDPTSTEESGWMPDDPSAQAWYPWVTSPHTN